MRIAPVVLEDGTQAIDVDNDRTYAIAETLLRRVPKVANVIYLPPREALAIAVG